VFPTSPAKSPSSASQSPAEPQFRPTKTKHAPAPGGSSTDSAVRSDVSSTSVVQVTRPRSASSPPSTSHANLEGAGASSTLVVQYPVVRKQTVSGSWATVSTTQPVTQPRMSDSDPRFEIWSSRLSTIPSESEPRSQSVSSSQGSISPTSAGPASPRLRRVIGSIVSSMSDQEYGASASSIPIPPPLFSPQRRLPSPPMHDGDEGEDTLGELQSPQLQPKRSGYLSKIRGLSRPSSSESIKSQMSFQGENLAWVK